MENQDLQSFNKDWFHCLNVGRTQNDQSRWLYPCTYKRLKGSGVSPFHWISLNWPNKKELTKILPKEPEEQYIFSVVWPARLVIVVPVYNSTAVGSEKSTAV